ncbi:MAG: hypothetical protein AAFR47_23950, partial [Pseudomonadota bacterium]
FCAALDKAMSILPRDRVQSAQEWLDLLAGKTKIKRTARPKSRLAPADSRKLTETKRSKAPALVAAVSLLAAAGGGAYYYLDPLEGGASSLVGVFGELALGTEDFTSTSSAAGMAGLGLEVQDSAQTSAFAPPSGDEVASPVALRVALNQTPLGEAGANQAAMQSPDTRQGIVGPGGLSSGWVVDFPFAVNGDDDLTIASVEPGLPAEIEPGLIVKSIQGLPITTMDQATDASRLSAPAPDGRWASVAIDLEDPLGGQALEANARMAIVYESALPSGLTLQTRWIEDAWQTVIIGTPDDPASTVRVGDVLVAVLPDQAAVTDSDMLRELLTRSIEAGTASLRVAVRREGSIWVETMAVGATAG